MPTYETPNYKGYVPAPSHMHGAQGSIIPVTIQLPALTRGVALAANDIIKLAWLPPYFVCYDALVMNPDGLLATLDLGFGELVTDGYTFDATGDEIIDGGTANVPLRASNVALASEAPQEHKRPIQLKVLTVSAPPTEGIIEVILNVRPRNVQDRY